MIIKLSWWLFLHMICLITFLEQPSTLTGSKRCKKKSLHFKTTILGFWHNYPQEKRLSIPSWYKKSGTKPTWEVERYKVRLIEKDYTQVEGIDFHETFYPVTKFVKVCTMLAVMVQRNWSIHQIDVNVFLHWDLDEEVYMKIPLGFSRKGETCVCWVRKSLYRLRQAS